MKIMHVVLLVLAASACGATSHSSDELRLYVFDCGTVRLESLVSFGIADDETDVREGAAPCYMIEHPGGRMLWDGGVASTYASTPGWHALGWGAAVRLNRTLADQLGEMGLSMSSFDYVAFSHLHATDHLGVAHDLDGGRLIIQRAEYEAAFGDTVTIIDFDPAQYERLRDMDRLLLEGDHDVFGDGRVRIYATPGHTPGHQVLLVDLLETGPVMLSGDLYHFPISRERQRVPVFNWDEAQTRESMRRVEAIVAERGAQLWIGHDAALFDRQRKAPAYYR
jgi:N-acyl homoserine lactone hydrolase